MLSRESTEKGEPLAALRNTLLPSPTHGQQRVIGLPNLGSEVQRSEKPG